MQAFAKRMQAVREEVVQLIMWEIGKSRADSEKEFDRTVEYIRATIEALKEQDNANSRFLVVEGTIGLIRRMPLGVVLCSRKDSAEGTLSVTDALRSFSIRSMIATKQTPASEQLLDTIAQQHKSKFINTRFIF
jgi:hypothetical protein